MKRNKYAGVLVCAATLSVVSVFATAEQQVKASVESQTKTVAKVLKQQNLLQPV